MKTIVLTIHEIAAFKRAVSGMKKALEWHWHSYLNDTFNKRYYGADTPPSNVPHLLTLDRIMSEEWTKKFLQTPKGIEYKKKFPLLTLERCGNFDTEGMDWDTHHKFLNTFLSWLKTQVN